MMGPFVKYFLRNSKEEHVLKRNVVLNLLINYFSN